MKIRLSLMVIGALGAWGARAAGAEKPGDDGPAACFRYADARPTAAQPGADAVPPAPPRFGEAGSRWWTVGGGIGHDFNGSTDTDLNLTYSYFLAKDVEFAAELGAWHFNQSGENSVGGSLAMVARWHFINTGPWTVYTDVGIGVLATGDAVPDGGTSFDLMPRAGVGCTRELGEGGTRLQVGLRWHHVSNARIHGDQNNPARDQPMVYAGIVFPF